jgi:hypothetical protein
MRNSPQARMIFPEVSFPTIKVPQPDGSILFKPGKPVAVEAEIGTREAARLLGMFRRWVETECELGRFKTAHKPGTQPKSNWKIARSEVLARREMEPN